jgi:cephalosporin hydroxylase
LINETFEKKNDILWGFGINPQTQVELHERWVDSYQIDIKTLENWQKFKSTRT